ncbi:Flp pilus assembly protein CpaB [Bogoriella caseilytica]|uniref:Pilus assembly protein CpaB n=1 Tax=Bogoriella caseilytica TaxID=56055 RepID=A0A3N2BDY2_9MICO|nr:RcpC/CpaB family pilus assembly protein [Bogoriella caseilytica]ROR73244.1 pilus assembly protein CpaB [Bogoriella caseilytica]
MNRRVLAAVVALLLAAVGSFVLLQYVSAADQRAVAGLEPVRVLVTTEAIAEGTPAEDLAESVSSELVPATAVGPGALSSLDELGGQVTATALEPGEQVLAGRFILPEELAETAEVEVPDDLHQVSILLEPQRVLGGQLAPGAAVGVIISVDGEDPRTHLTLHQVLVTRVQGGITSASPEAEDGSAPPAPAPMPEGSVMVTLALSPDEAEKLVFAAEFERVWLSLEGPEAPESGTRIVARDTVHE